MWMESGNIWKIKAVPIHTKAPCLVIQAAEENCISAGGPGFRPLLVLNGLFTSPTASISPGCFGTSWEVETILIRLRAADTLWHKETRTPVSRAGCVQRISRPSPVGLLAEARLLQGHSSQLHLLLRLSVAFIYTSIFLAVLVCHWLPTKYEEPNSHWCSTHNRKSEGGKHSVIWPTGRWAYRRERRFLFLYAKNWFPVL